MASGQAHHAAKLSFATVAASPYVPSDPTANNNAMVPPRKEKTSPPGKSDIMQGDISAPIQNGPTTVSTTAEMNSNAHPPISTPAERPKVEDLDPHLPRVLENPVTGETNSPDSSDEIGKAVSIDGGKSVGSGSGTTFALDEKESLRPDDSASTRAVDEEDMFSAAGSRVGSDSGARAFRDQLREISVMGSHSQRLGMPGRLSSSHGPGSGPLSGTVPSSEPRLVQGPESSSEPAGEKPHPPPDEKLMEALESPRDRIFVIKLEQDILDFIKDAKQHSLDLPQFNAFYRMLAHRLADYYQLGHVVDSFTPQSSVRLFKNAPMRMPPPLSGLPIPSAGNTPPPTVQTRKIMRRGEDSRTASGANTGANSENPSKSTSEVGEGSESEAGHGGSESRSKTALTREEREAKYREVRERIFGQADSEQAETSQSTDDKDLSRSSSANGKKKLKKNRANNDDGFEARSQYIPQYSNAYSMPNYSGDGFYPQYPGMAAPSYGPMNGAMQPMMHGFAPNPAGGDMPQPEYQWMSPVNGNGMPMQGYPSANGYDMSADFNRGMQSFQSAPSLPGQNTKMSPSIGPFPDVYGQQNRGAGWGPMPYPPYQMAPQAPFTAHGSAPGAHFPYGQMPRSPYGMRPNPQQPLPGSYTRGQFNPQSQAFVPVHRMNSSPLPAPQHQMNAPVMNMAPQQMTPQSIPQQVVTPPNHGHGPQAPPARSGPPSQFNSPRSVPRSLPTPPLAQLGAVARPPSQPTPPRDQARPLHSPNPGSSGPTSTPGSTGSPNPQSNTTIAKWGVPAHLPPKPPPPANMEPQRYLQAHSHRPPPHVYSTPPRHPGNPPVHSAPNGVSNGMSSTGDGEVRK